MTKAAAGHPRVPRLGRAFFLAADGVWPPYPVRKSVAHRYMELLPRVRPLDVPQLLLTLQRRYQLDRLLGPGVTDAAMDQWWQQVAPLLDALLYFGQDMAPVPRR